MERTSYRGKAKEIITTLSMYPEKKELLKVLNGTSEQYTKTEPFSRQALVNLYCYAYDNLDARARTIMNLVDSIID